MGMIVGRDSCGDRFTDWNPNYMKLMSALAAISLNYGPTKCNPSLSLLLSWLLSSLMRWFVAEVQFYSFLATEYELILSKYQNFGGLIGILDNTNQKI